jgi:hypothetical protein
MVLKTDYSPHPVTVSECRPLNGNSSSTNFKSTDAEREAAMALASISVLGRDFARMGWQGNLESIQARVERQADPLGGSPNQESPMQNTRFGISALPHWNLLPAPEVFEYFQNLSIQAHQLLRESGQLQPIVINERKSLDQAAIPGSNGISQPSTPVPVRRMTSEASPVLLDDPNCKKRKISQNNIPEAASDNSGTPPKRVDSGIEPSEKPHHKRVKAKASKGKKINSDADEFSKILKADIGQGVHFIDGSRTSWKKGWTPDDNAKGISETYSGAIHLCSIQGRLAGIVGKDWIVVGANSTKGIAAKNRKLFPDIFSEPADTENAGILDGWPISLTGNMQEMHSITFNPSNHHFGGYKTDRKSSFTQVASARSNEVNENTIG